MSEELQQPVALDPGEAAAIFDGSDWFRDSGVAGLYALIPILGPVALIGWGQELHQQGLRARNRLLPVRFDAHLAVGQATAPAILGWPVLLMALDGLRAVLVVIGMAVVTALAGQVDSEILGAIVDGLGGVSDLTSSALTLLWLPWVVILPELMRRVYQGEPFPWQSPGPTLRVIQDNPEGYLKVTAMMGAVLAGAWTVHGMFGWLTLLVFPLFWAVLSHLSAQWQRMVSARGTPGTV